MPPSRRTRRLPFALLLTLLSCSSGSRAPVHPLAEQPPPSARPAPCTAANLDTCREHCNSGDDSACSLLLLEYERSAQGLAKDGARLASACEPACERGHGACCYWLGMRSLQEPQGAQRPQTLSLLDRACELGESQACVALVTQLFQNPQDAERYPLALSARLRACKLGVTEHCRDAALFSLDPYQLVPSQGASALALFSIGCQSGDAISCAYAAGLSDSEEFLTPDLPRAAASLDQGCQLGDGSACVRRMARRAIGRGVPADAEGALTELRRACDAKVEAACRSISLLTSTEAHPWDECSQDQDCILGSRGCDIWCGSCWHPAEGLNAQWAAAAGRDCAKRAKDAERWKGPRPNCGPCPPAPRAAFLLEPSGVACVSRHCVAY